MNNKNSKNEDQGKRTGYYEPVKPSFLLFFIIITVFITIIITNFIQQRQLKKVKSEIAQLDKKQDKLEIGRIEDLSVRQLAEKIDYVMSQQEVTVSSSQGMLDYMTFYFSIIGIFFLLASGYFLYRQQKSEKREDEGWVLAKDLLELVTESQSFVVQVQKELQKQQESQKEQQKQIK